VTNFRAGLWGRSPALFSAGLCASSFFVLPQQLLIGRYLIAKNCEGKWCTVADDHSQCKLCASFNLIEFSAEVGLHIPGLKGIKNDPIFVFPKVLVCPACGFMESNLSAEDLRLLRVRTTKVEKQSSLFTLHCLYV